MEHTYNVIIFERSEKNYIVTRNAPNSLSSELRELSIVPLQFGKYLCLPRGLTFFITTVLKN